MAASAARPGPPYARPVQRVAAPACWLCGPQPPDGRDDTRCVPRARGRVLPADSDGEDDHVAQVVPGGVVERAAAGHDSEFGDWRRAVDRGGGEVLFRI